MALLAILVGQGQTITVYDCEHPKVTLKALDLTGAYDCPTPERDYEEPIEQKAQILQIDASVPITAFRCRVTQTRTITQCGFDSLTYGSRTPIFKQAVGLTPEECKTAVHDGVLHVDGQDIRVKPGEIRTHTYFSHGSVTHNGRCKTATFTTMGVLYTGAYEEVTIVAQLDTISGTVNVGTGDLTFNNGLRVRASSEVVRDAIEGLIAWKYEEPKCVETTSEIYHGTVEIHKRKGFQSLHALVVLEDKETKQYAGLILKKPRSVCHVRCHDTQIVGITVCLLREHDTPLPGAVFRHEVDQQRAEVRSQMGYISLTNQQNNNARFAVLHNQLCENARKTLNTKLHMLADNNSQYSLLDIYGPGHLLIKAGAVAYIHSCVAVEAALHQPDNCTQEIPVLVNGTKTYADPMTMVIRRFPQIVPCSSAMPVQWQLGGEWYCATPAVTRCQEPEKLRTGVDEYHDAKVGKGLDGSIFSEKQKEQHDRYVDEVESRGSMVSSATHNAVESAKDGVLGPTMSVIQRFDLVNQIKESVIPLFSWLGEGWTFLIGLLFVIGLIKGCVGASLRVTQLYKLKGCGVWLMAALWQTSFHIISAPMMVIRTVAKMGGEEDLDRGPLVKKSAPVDDLDVEKGHNAGGDYFAPRQQVQLELKKFDCVDGTGTGTPFTMGGP